MNKREVALALASLVFVVCQVYFDLTLPDFMSEITRLVKTPGSELSEIAASGGKMLLCALGSLVVAVLTVVCASKLALSFAGALRSRLFDKVMQFSLSEMSNFSTASLITRCTNDVQQVQQLIVFGLMMLIKAPIMALWAILKISGKQFEWTMATAIAVIVLLLAVGLIMKIVLPYFRRMQRLIDDVNRVTRENLSGISVVHAYNAEKYQCDKFEESNLALTSNQMFVWRSMSFLMPSIQLVMNMLTMSIFWIGGVLIANASLDQTISLFSDMMVFSMYAIQVVMSFMMLVLVFMMWPRASVAAKRINEVLNTDISIKDGSSRSRSVGAKGEIEFRDVSFSYNDSVSNVLSHISFKAECGQTIAIIGSTGCGKSTLVNLIPRFYDVTSGEVLVDGVNVKNYKLEDLREKISYIAQNAILFEGDISSNIKFGESEHSPISDERINRSIEIAQAKEFVEAEEGGVHAFVAQGGVNFSGGQRQRLSIARGLATNPEIMILDDTFSALDYATDRSLRRALDDECSGVTRLIVAQRISTIRNADKILVLDDGVIVGQGKHDELLETCEVYKQIALSQLSGDELGV